MQGGTKSSIAQRPCQLAGEGILRSSEFLNAHHYSARLHVLCTRAQTPFHCTHPPRYPMRSGATLAAGVGYCCKHASTFPRLLVPVDGFFACR